MASNQFGNIFRITTWGESHGKAIGVVIDGCPSGLPITAAEINRELSYRRPGLRPLTSARSEPDEAEILSGVYEDVTTGAPISIVISNRDADPSAYAPIRDLWRPGHAQYTYRQKYGHTDPRGGGRSSARETACRVAAGAIAKKLLMTYGIEVCAFLLQVAATEAVELEREEITSLREKTLKSPIFCPDAAAERKIIHALKEAIEQGDSLGGIVELRAEGLPPTLGDPTYEKLDANLAKALMTIHATKGVEIGSGFRCAQMKGSEHNDLFQKNIEGNIITETNFSGGILGGISNGMPLIARVAFKPTSSIALPQPTFDKKGDQAILQLPKTSRHDPCLAIRGTPIVEAMGALVLADCLLMDRSTRLLKEPSLPY